MNPTLPRFNNIELLRFLLAWAVVGFHIVVRQQFDPFGLAALRPTWAHGWYAVDLFFTISFFFLVLKTKPEPPFLPFCRDKWLRLAPLAIVSSALYYIMHRCGYCRWNWPANLETFLLIRDWAAYARWGQNLGPAWYCCAYLLIAAFYLGLIKALPKKLIPLIIGITAYLSWRFYLDISGSAHPRFGSILGTDGICRGLFCLGLGYLLAHLYTHTPPSPQKSNIRKALYYTVIEIACLCLIIGHLMAGAFQHLLDHLLVILLFAVLFWLFIRRAGYLSRLLEKNWCATLGKYSYGIFIMHRPVVDFWEKGVLPPHRDWAVAHPCLVLGSMAAAIMLMAILGHHFVEAPIMRYLKKKRQASPLTT